MQKLYSFLVVVFLFNLPFNLAHAEDDRKPVKNLIIMIADGFSPAGATLARYVKGKNLNLDSILTGTIQTKSYDSLISDSAAGATAYSTGFKTNNGVVGLHPKDNSKLINIMQVAKKHNLVTGIVVKDKITGATPASFSSHVLSRNMQMEIAEQQIESGVDILFGGGLKYFLPKEEGGSRTDGKNLLIKAKSYGITVINTLKQLKKLESIPVIGLFAKSTMSYDIDRLNSKEPSLKQMTEKALELLSQNSNGFVLMIEGSRIDHAAHNNDPASFAREIMGYDETMALVKDFVDNNKNTLMISVSDHGTGGVTVGRDVDNNVVYEYNAEVLRQIMHSAEYFDNMIKEGILIDNVIDSIGINDLSSNEISRIKSHSIPAAAILDVINERSRTGWTTYGHSAIDVNLYSYGACRDSFIGNFDNTDIIKKVSKLMELDL